MRRVKVIFSNLHSFDDNQVIARYQKGLLIRYHTFEYKEFKLFAYSERQWCEACFSCMLIKQTNNQTWDKPKKNCYIEAYPPIAVSIYTHLQAMDMGI